jgi:hypothetical protein
MSGIIGGVGAVSGILGETTVPTVAGMVKEVQWNTHTTDSNNQTVSSSTFHGFGTAYNMSVPDGQSVVMEGSGGMLEFDAGVTWSACINYATSSFGSATAGTFDPGTGTNNAASKYAFGPAATMYSNSSGSTVTLYYRLGLKGWGGDVTARWYADNNEYLALFLKATRFIT